jgi:hypothetical protein
MVFNPNLQQYFSYIVAVSFISGGNRSTRRKPIGLSPVAMENSLVVLLLLGKKQEILF